MSVPTTLMASSVYQCKKVSTCKRSQTRSAIVQIFALCEFCTKCCCKTSRKTRHV